MEGYSNFESKSLEALQQPQENGQSVGELWQPSQTGPNNFCTTADISTNIGVTESKSSEALQQPQGNGEEVDESSQPTHTTANDFAMRVDTSTNVNTDRTESRSSEALKQPQGNDQSVGESSQPTHTALNNFSTTPDISTNVNIVRTESKSSEALQQPQGNGEGVDESSQPTNTTAIDFAMRVDSSTNVNTNRTESRSSEALKQPQGNDQSVGKSSQPTHTALNKFSTTADISTNVNVVRTAQSPTGQPQPVQSHPVYQLYYQPAHQQYFQPPPQHTPNTIVQPQYPVHTTQPGAYPAMYQHQVPPSIHQNTYIGRGRVQINTVTECYDTGKTNVMSTTQLLPAKRKDVPTALQHSNAPPALYVPDELGNSISTTFCCCMILGLIAIFFSCQANGLRNVDPEKALSKARTARALNISAVVSGLTISAIILATQL